MRRKRTSRGTRAQDLNNADSSSVYGRRRLYTRTLFFVTNYVVLLVSWTFGFESLPLGGIPGLVAGLLGALLALGCLTAAVVIHRGFPKEHSKASDFGQLLTTGPYGYVRHPFYSSLIALNYFASLAFQSLYGIVASTLLLPVWWYLARSEEWDLAQEWGQAYVEYRKATPMLFPRYRRRKQGEAGTACDHA